MNYDSIIKGLGEAVKISNGEIKGRKQLKHGRKVPIHQMALHVDSLV